MDDTHITPPSNAISGGPIAKRDLKSYSQTPVDITDSRVEGGDTKYGISFTSIAGNPDQWWIFATSGEAAGVIANINTLLAEPIGT